jgi:acyl-CoA dehydrogenase
MRWLGQSRRAFDMLCERRLTRYTHGSILAEKQMVQDWIAESYAEMNAARLLTLQAAWKMDQLHAAGQALQRCPHRDRGDQVLGCAGDVQHHRSGHPDPRLARLHHRPSAGVDVSRGTRGPYLRRSRRGAQGHCGPQVLKGYRPSDPPIEHIPTRRAAALEKYAGYLDELAVSY